MLKGSALSVPLHHLRPLDVPTLALIVTKIEGSMRTTVGCHRAQHER